MPRKPFQIQAFHGGINSKSDKRDISDTQVAEAIDISIDDIGMVTNAGAFVDASIGGTVPIATASGYGLFRFSSDYDDDYNGSATPVRTDYLLSWRNADKQLYWSPGGGNWASPTHLDTSSDWAGSETPQAIFYNVDGAIRMSDAGFNPANNPLWIGAIERTLFTDASTTVDVKGWFKQLQELTAPAGGISLRTAPASLVAADLVHWHIRNIKDECESIPMFDDSSGWSMQLTSGSHRQTESRISGGFDGATYYRRLGWQMVSESNDDSEFNQHWTSPNVTNAGGDSKTLDSGKSAYIALRAEDMDARNMWQGTHSKVVDENKAWAITFANPKIQLYNATADWVRWEIELSSLFDADPGEWVILELPYDEATEKSNDSHTSIVPVKHRFIADLSIDLTGGSVTTSSSQYTDSAVPVMHISDFRIGDSEKSGSSGAKGVKKFAYSFIYDENEDAESLLRTLAGQDISLHPNDYGYKIGITGHVRNAWTNKRITGANLYMIDEDIPYRVAQLDFLKGLKGSWEAEFPADKLGSTIDAFTTEYTSGSKSNSVETTGLPLLESYESLNGFKPTVKTISAKYKTAVVLNRKVYIGNIEQDGKVYGDRMIKSVTNSFDCFPSVGREIDVVINDGDDIIKLETYADRILQFKRNTMYLINATKSAEFLEDTFVGKGVLHPGAVCKTDFGVAWANENGCYLYDGQKVNNLTESVVSETEWATHMNANSQIFYFPSKRKLFITGDWTQGSTAVNDLYEYSISTQGWTKLDAKAASLPTNFVLDIDNIVKCVNSAGTTLKWDDSVAATSKYSLKTKDIDFGNPATLKRLYRALITWKVDGGGDSNISVKYGTNGEVANTKEFTGGDLGVPSGGSSNWQVTDLIPDTLTEANSIRSIQLHLGYNDGAVPSGFAVNDITLVYRERSLR